MAGSSQGVKAGRAFVEVGVLDKTGAALKRIQAKLQATAASIRMIGAKAFASGAVLSAPFFASLKSFAETGSNFADMATRTGASVEKLSELGFAASMTGASLEDVEMAMRNLSKTMSGPTDAAFEKAAATIAAIEDPLKRVAKARELFGKSGTKLLPMIMELRELQALAKSKGIGFTTQDAKLADALGDSLDMLKVSFKSIVMVVGAQLAPTVIPLIEWMTNGTAAALQWVRENTKIVTVAFGLAAGITAVGAALVAAGVSMSVVITFGGALVAVLAKIGAVIVSWPGMLAVAGAAWLTWSGNGGKIIKWLGEQFGWLLETAKFSFGGIVDALLSGELGLAAKIAWQGVRVAWAEGVAFVIGKLDELKASFDDFVKGLKSNGFFQSLLEFDDVVTRIVQEQNAQNDPEFEQSLRDRRLRPGRGEGTGWWDQREGDAGVRPLTELEKMAVELAKARAELQELVDQAKQARERGAMPAFPNAPDLSRIPNGLQQAINRSEGSGTFAAGVAAMIGANELNIQDKQLKVLQQIKDNGDDVLAFFGRGGGGPQFA